MLEQSTGMTLGYVPIKRKWNQKDMSILCFYRSHDFIVAAADTRSTIINRQDGSISYNDKYRKLFMKNSTIFASTGLNTFDDKDFASLADECSSGKPYDICCELSGKMQPYVSKHKIGAILVVAALEDGEIQFCSSDIKVDEKQTITVIYDSPPPTGVIWSSGETWAVEYCKKLSFHPFSTAQEAEAFLIHTIDGIIKMDKACIPNSIGGSIESIILQLN